jgi:hypothetical protein
VHSLYLFRAKVSTGAILDLAGKFSAVNILDRGEYRYPDRNRGLHMPWRNVAVVALALSWNQLAIAGDTAIGPTAKLCKEVSSEPVEKASLSIMWAIGFVSGVNALTSTDFLKGRDMSGLIDRFRDVCLDSPNKTVLVVARDMVARLRSEAGQLEVLLRRADCLPRTRSSLGLVKDLEQQEQSRTLRASKCGVPTQYAHSILATATVSWSKL